MQIGQEEIKLSLFTGDVIVYVENLKDSAKKKKLLELISNDSKVAGYKGNIQKPITFLFTRNEQEEFEFKKTPFILAPAK